MTSNLKKYIPQNETVEEFVRSGINNGKFKFTRTPSVEANYELAEILKQENQNPTDYGIFEE